MLQKDYRHILAQSDMFYATLAHDMGTPFDIPSFWNAPKCNIMCSPRPCDVFQLDLSHHHFSVQTMFSVETCHCPLRY